MAVNSITFGNVNSADYGIYISGEGVFDAPKRAVEMVNIPGRNGALAIDQGYYENIVVTYPAHNYEPEMSDFKENLSAFRNALASQVGYQRLSDTFHPNEYRMAVFDEGLDINPIKYNTASQFDIKFDCKPQRFLTSGETETTVSSGDTLTNPTQYDSSPLIMAKGYGNLTMNGFTINLSDEQIGEVELLSPTSFSGVYKSANFNGNQRLLYEGDSISANMTLQARIIPITANGYTNITLSSVSDSDTSHFLSTGYVIPSTLYSSGYLGITCTAWGNYTKGTDLHCTNRITVTGTVSGTGGTDNFTVYFDVQTDFYSDRISVYWTYTHESYHYVTVDMNSDVSNISSVKGVSTMSVLGDPTYIDCDLGEAYQIADGEIVPLNRYIILGSDLPVLKSGVNTITFDNTITELKIKPRWWKL